MQWAGEARKRHQLVPPKLEALLPKEIPGWEIEDRALAETPEMMQKVEGILNFDSAIFRLYRRGGLEIGVYMAYWLPAKTDVNSVDAHTPDICWVNSGWSMRKRGALPPQPAQLGPVPVPSVRDFTLNGNVLSVAYWHVNGAELRMNHSIWVGGLGSMDRVKRRIRQIWSSVTEPPEQQLFIRISSNVDLERELGSPPIVAVVELISQVLNGRKLYEIKN